MWQRLLIMVGALSGLLATTFVGPSVAFETVHRAGLVVRYGSGEVATACVTFTEPTISGFDLLQQSGLGLIANTDGGAAAVCKIGKQGCNFPSEPCFCQCQGGAPCQYWSYSQLGPNGWQFSRVGASATRVQPGGVDGWAWGSGSVANGAQPPLLGFEQICAVPAAPTTVPATRPRPTSSPVPPTRPRPSVTTVPSARPVATVNQPSPLPTKRPPLPTARTDAPMPTVVPTTAVVASPPQPDGATEAPLAPASAVATGPIAATGPAGGVAPVVEPSAATQASTITAALAQSAAATNTVVAAAPVPSQAATASATSLPTTGSPPRTGIGSYVIFGLIFGGLIAWSATIRRHRRR